MEDETIFIEGDKVKELKTIGYGPQYTVALAKTESGIYIVEIGISGHGQYVEVLAELNELEDIVFETEKKGK